MSVSTPRDYADVKEDSTVAASETEPGEEPGDEVAAVAPPRASMRAETTVRLANLRAKVHALSRKANGAFDAITDLIAEASLNKASLLEGQQAAAELVKLLAMPVGQRRATTYRDLCQLGRNLELPPWHGSERRQQYVWYHCCHRLRLVEAEAGQELVRQGDMGDTCFWLLTGTMEEMPEPPPPPPPSPPPRPPPSPPPRSASESPRKNEAAGAGRGGGGGGYYSDDGGEGGERGGAEGSKEEVSLPPPTPARIPGKEIKVWERMGQEALQGNRYAATVQATSRCQLAALSRSDYQAVLQAAARQSFEGLRAMSYLLASRSSRHPSLLSELASLLSVTDLFRATDPEFRAELCGLAEFLALPEGTILFEEGDRVDFSYIILKGEVVLSRFSEARHAPEDVVVRTTGQHFGTLSALGPERGNAGGAATAGGGGGGAGQGGSSSGAAGGGGNGGAGGGGAGDKRRNFSARCTQPTEFAIITKVGYNRLLRSQLQKSIAARLEVLQSMAIMKAAATHSSLTRIAVNCQDETFSPGTVLVDPAAPPSRLFFIVEGQAKLLWVADGPGQVPPAANRLLDKNGAVVAPSSGGGGVSGPGLPAGMGSGGGGAQGSGGGGGLPSHGGGSQCGDGVYAASGAAAAGGTGGRGLKKRQQSYVYELALLSRGDIVNGMVLHGRASCFTVVAATTVKVMSLEVLGGMGGLEQLLGGRDAAAALRELVLRQAEMHRERAAHMVSVRQTSSALMEGRGAAAPALPDAALPPSFLQHYVPRVPGEQAGGAAGLPLMGYAAAVSDPRLFQPGALNHGDVLKLVAAVGQSVLDSLPPAPPMASATAATRGAAAGGGGGSSAAGAGSGSAMRTGSPASTPLRRQGSHLHLLQQQQQQAAAAAAALQAAQAHLTTVVAQPVAIPRTRMRAPSPGMAKELGLEAPPLQSAGSSANLSPPASLTAGGAPLEQHSSLALLPDPAAHKTRNGKPRARHRTQLGLPFAGNVAMLVLENQSHLVKVVNHSPASLDCVSSLRMANSASCGGGGGSGSGGEEDDGDDGRFGADGPPGPSLIVVLPDPRPGDPPKPQQPEPQPDPVAAAAEPLGAEASGAEAMEQAGADGVDVDARDRRSEAGTAQTDPDEDAATDAEVLRVVTPPPGAASGTTGASSQAESRAASSTGASQSEGGGRSSRAAEGSSDGDAAGSGGGAEPSWRQSRVSVYPSTSLHGQASSLSYVEPLTLAASQTAITSSLHGGVAAAAAAQPRSSSVPGMATAPSLAAGQLHAPPTNPYLKPAAPAGSPGTAGAFPSPALAAAAVVQPSTSAATAKHTANRLTTIMSAGPLGASSASAAAAASALASAAAAPAPATPTSSPPPKAAAADSSGAAAPAKIPPELAAAAPAAVSGDSVVILPRMVTVYEGALFDGSGGGGLGSPSGGRGGPTRLAALGPAAVSAAAAAGSSIATRASSPPGTHSSPLPPMPGHGLPNSGSGPGDSHSTVQVLPSLSPPRVTICAEPPQQAGPPASPGAQPSGPHVLAPGRIRSLDTMPTYKFGIARDLLGYYSSADKIAAATSVGDGMVFTGGIGGRSMRHTVASASGVGGVSMARRVSGAPLRRGGLGGVSLSLSLRELAGVNELPRSGHRGVGRAGLLALKQQEGPELPLEVDADAPPLQDHKLSEPNQNDLKYILTRWSTKWAQERSELCVVSRLGRREPGPLHRSAPGSPAGASGGGGGLTESQTQVELSQFGYTADDLVGGGAAGAQQEQQQQPQQESVGVGAFKRPLAQLGLFGVPFLGGTPRGEGTGDGAASGANTALRGDTPRR